MAEKRDNLTNGQGRLETLNPLYLSWIEQRFAKFDEELPHDFTVDQFMEAYTQAIGDNRYPGLTPRLRKFAEGVRHGLSLMDREHLEEIEFLAINMHHRQDLPRTSATRTATALLADRVGVWTSYEDGRGGIHYRTIIDHSKLASAQTAIMDGLTRSIEGADPKVNLRFPHVVLGYLISDGFRPRVPAPAQASGQ